MNRIVAPAIGELRLEYLPRQLLLDGEFEVVVVGNECQILETVVRLTDLWKGRGWAIAFACPRCEQPSHVLRAWGSELLCPRCLPRPSEASRLSRREREKRRQLGDRSFTTLLRVLVDEENGERGSLNKAVRERFMESARKGIFDAESAVRFAKAELERG